MSRVLSIDSARASANAPRASGLVERLAEAIDAGAHADATQRQLLQEALAMAAEAQQQLADQQARIAYLESLSATDELTRLLNRRGFRAEFARTLARADRYEEHGVLMLIDLDGFKEINDGLGHLAGDRVLRFVAGLLSSAVRRSDYVARLGGDEFVVVLTNTAEEQGLSRARALEKAIKRATVPWKQARIHIRASIGLATFGSRDSESELLHRADLALYERKNHGAHLAAV